MIMPDNEIIESIKNWLTLNIENEIDKDLLLDNKDLLEYIEQLQREV